MKIEKRRIDQTLLELLIGIIVFTLLCQVIGIIFVEEDIKYSAGLWIGAILACASSIHMWWSLNHNFEQNINNEKGAQAFAIRGNLIRYGIILVIFLVVCITDFAYPFSAFLGILGLKAGAYLQPITHNIQQRMKDKKR